MSFCEIKNNTSFEIRDTTKVPISMYDRKPINVSEMEAGSWVVDESGSLYLVLETNVVEMDGDVTDEIERGWPVHVTVTVESFEQG